MQIIKVDENTLSIKLSLGRIDIKDNMVDEKTGIKCSAIGINMKHGVKIKGGGRLILLEESGDD